MAYIKKILGWKHPDPMSIMEGGPQEQDCALEKWTETADASTQGGPGIRIYRNLDFSPSMFRPVDRFSRTFTPNNTLSHKFLYQAKKAYVQQVPDSAQLCVWIVSNQICVKVVLKLKVGGQGKSHVLKLKVGGQGKSHEGCALMTHKPNFLITCQ